MASGSNKTLAVIVEFMRAQGKYDVLKIAEEIAGLQTVLENIKPLLDAKMSIKIDGIQNIITLKNALNSLNQSLPAFNSRITKLGETLKSLNNVDSQKLVQFQDAISIITDILSKFSIGQLSQDFKKFVDVVIQGNKELINAIRPLQDFENAIGKLDIKIQASINGLKQFADVAALIQQLSGGIAGNLGNVRTPVFKSKESDIASQIGQYQKLTSIIERASVSVIEFNKVGSLKDLDPGGKKKLADDIKSITSSYNSLQTVIGKLNVELEFLEQQENADVAIIQRLQATLSEYNLAEQKHLQLLKQTTQAEVALENAERKERDAFREQFEALGGIIERQARFVVGATVLAESANFVRVGFKNAFETLNEVARILVVSRSEFLNTAQTAKLLTDTIDKFSTKTGESVKNVGSILKEFGSAGLTTEQSIAALGSTLNNIIATDSSVIETTRLVASTYNILGNTVTGVSDQVANFTRINDIFARGTNESSLEMDQLVEALKFSLPVAKEAGIDLEGLTAILGQLADQGLRGGNAGRSLRASFEQLSKDAPRIAKALNIKIDLTKPLDFLDIIRQYGKEIKGQEINVEQLGTVFEKFGLRGADTFLLLAQNVDKLDKKLLDLKENSQGAAEIGANIKLQDPERQFARFTENIARLSRTAFEPLIAALLKTLTFVNDLFDRFKLLGDDTVVKLGVQILTLAGALAFLVKIGGFIAPTIGGALASLGTSFTAIAAGTLTLSTLIPVILAVVAALTLLVTAYKLIEGNSATTKKALDEQIIKYQQTSNEANKLKNAYLDVAKQLEKTHLEFAKGNLTFDDYQNALGNIAQVSPEVADVIYNFGNDAKVASEKLRELAKAQEEVVKVQKELQGQAELSKLKIDIVDSEKLIENFKKVKEYNESFKRKGSGGISADFNKEQLEKSKQEIFKFQQEITENLKNTVQLSFSSSSEEVRKLAGDLAIKLKTALGFASVNPQVTQLPDIIDSANKKIKEFKFDEKVLLDIKDLEKAPTEFSKGFEGLKNKFVLDFNVAISERSVEDVRKQLEEIPTRVDKEQFGKNFVNDLNFKGLAQIFEEQLKAGGFQGIKDIQAQFESISKLTTNNAQEEALLKFASNIANQKKEGIKDDKQIAAIEEQRLSILNQISTLFIDQKRLKEAQIDAAKLQAQQEVQNKYEQGVINLTLKEARTIRRDIVADAQAKLNIDKAQYSVQASVYEKIVEQSKNQKLSTEEETRKLSQLKRRVDALKQVTQQTENIRKIEFDISKNLKEANTSLENSKLVGSLLVDQDVAKSAAIADQVDNLEKLYLLGYDVKIIQTDLLKIDVERNALRKQELDYYIQTQKTLYATQNQYSVLLSGDTKRSVLLAGIRNNTLELRQIQDKYNSAVQGGNKFIEQQVQYRGEISKKILDIVNDTIKLSQLDDQQIINARTLLDLREKITKSYEDLTKGLVSKQEENVKKLIGNLFEFGNFKEIDKILKSIGIDANDTSQYYEDQSKTTAYILKNLREGKISVDGFPEPLKEALKLLQEVNSVSENIRIQQDKLNDLKFNGLKDQINKAIGEGGQEGYNKAIQLLGELNSNATKFNSKTGEVDYARTAKNIKDIEDFYELVKNIDTKKSPVENIINGVDIATNEFKTLGNMIDFVKGKLIELNNVGVLGPYSLEKKAPGGFGPAFAVGGLVPGSGSGDIVPAMLTPGEFVIPKDVVDKKGLKFFYDLIGGQGVQQFALGGMVRAYETGGLVSGGFSVGSGDLKEQAILTNQLLSDLILATNTKLDSVVTNAFNTDRHVIEGFDKLGNKLSSDKLYTILTSIYDRDTLINNSVNKSNDLLKNISDYTFGSNDLLKIIAQGTNEGYAAASADAKTVAKLAFGGFVGGSGSGDIIPAMLEPGEFVIPKDVVKSKGVEFFNKLISGDNGFMLGGMVKGYTSGGPVGFNPEGSGTPGSIASGINKLTGDIATLKLDASMRKLDDSIRELDSDITKLSKTDDQVTKALEAAGKEQLRSVKPILPGSDAATNKLLGSGGDNEKYSKLLDKIVDLEKRIKELEEGKAASKISGLSGVDKFFYVLGERYKKYRNDIKTAGVVTHNFYLEVSGAAADRILTKIFSIGDAFEKVFTEQLPTLLGFFLNDVIGSNVKIVEDYNKTKLDIAKTYKDQRAELIEQLKRNSISYFDFFDGIEDLNKKKRDADRDAAIKEKKDLSDNLKNNINKAVSTAATIVGETGKTFGDFISSIPALASHAFSGLGDIISKGLGKLGDISGGVGSVLGVVGGVVGTALGSAFAGAGQLFSFIGSGFAQLIPVVSQFILMLTDDTQYQALLDTINTLPAQLDTIVKTIQDRIPAVIAALVDNGGLQKLGQSFANALRAVMPEIAQAFVTIVPEALKAVVPVITAVFDSLPNFLTANFLAAFTGIPEFLITQFKSIVQDLLGLFSTKFPEIFELFKASFLQAISSIDLTSLSTDLSTALSSGIQTIVPLISNTLSQLAPQLVSSLAVVAPAFSSSIVKELPNIASSLLDLVSNLAESDIDRVDSIVNFFLEAVPKVFAKIPELLNQLFTQGLNLESLGTQVLTLLASIFDSVATAIPALIGSLLDGILSITPKIISGFIDFFTKILSTNLDIGKFTDLFARVFSELPNILKAVFVDFIPAFINALITSLTPDKVVGFINAFFDIVSKLIASETFGFDLSFLSTVKDAFEEIKPLVVDFVRSLQAFAKVINNQFGKEVGIIAEIIGKFFEVLSNPSVQNIIQSFIRIFNKFNDILKGVIKNVLEILLRIMTRVFDRLTNTLDKLFNKGSGLSDALDVLAKTFEDVAVILDPIITELLPVLEPLLTALVYSALIPMLLVLAPLIASLYVLVFVIDFVNKAVEVLAPVLAPLAPLFDALRPVMEKLIPVLIVIATTLILLATPLGPLILLFAALYAGFVLVTGAIQLFQLAMEGLSEILPQIIDTMNNGKNVIVQIFTDLINGLIDSIPGARSAIGNAQSGTGGGGGGGHFHLPHFATGGFVSGDRGVDKVRAQLTSGEFVVRKEVVDSVGKKFFDFVNSDSFLTTTRGMNRENKNGLISALSSEINNPGTNHNNLGTASPDLFNANANSRDYYLKNYYNGTENGANGIGITGSAPLNASANTTSQMAAIAAKLSSQSSGASQSVNTGESQGNISVNIEFHDCNFNGEDVANVVEQRLVEKLSNEQGQLARLVRDIKKDR